MSADQLVVAGAAAQPVGAAVALQAVGPVAADDVVAAAATEDDLDALQAIVLPRLAPPGKGPDMVRSRSCLRAR